MLCLEPSVAVNYIEAQMNQTPKYKPYTTRAGHKECPTTTEFTILVLELRGFIYFFEAKRFDGCF